MLQINLVELNEQRESAIAAKQAEMMAEEREARAERRERRRSALYTIYSSELSNSKCFE